MSDEELEPSVLGTQTYWQQTYTKEINNFDVHGDPGEVWFGEDSAHRVIDWIQNCDIVKDAPIIDLGCGNGYTLAELAKVGFKNLLGIDYCDEAIELAKRVTKSEFPTIKFRTFDIIEDNIDCLGTKFSLVHDKGTYDAISMNPEHRKRYRQSYIEQVAKMLADDGLFVITSCNWTEHELLKHFEEKMKLKCVIPSPQFKFAGKIGSVVSTVVFVKKINVVSNIDE